MTKTKDWLLIGTVMPSLILSQTLPVRAQAPTGAIILAQGAPQEQEGRPGEHRPGPGGQRPAQPPQRPGGPPPGAPPRPAAPEAPHVQPAPARPAPPPAQPAPRPAAPEAPQPRAAPPAPARPAEPPAAPPAPARPAAPPAAQPAPRPAAPEAPQTRPAIPTPAPAQPTPARPAAPPPAAQQPQPARPATPAPLPAPAPAAPAPAARPAQPPAAPAAPPAATPPQGNRPAGQPGFAPPAGQPNAQPPAAPGAPPQPGFTPGARPGAPPQPQAVPPAPQGQVQPPGGPQQRNSGIGPGGAAAIGAAAGLVGGFVAAQGLRSLGDVRQHRQETTQGGVTFIQEPGRVIERDNDRFFIRHDENERFRDLGLDVRTEQRGDDFVSIYDRPDGSRIVTITDANGRLIRRVRRFPDGREFVLIDNGFRGPPRPLEQEIVVLPPPPITIPRDRYIVDADRADEQVIYETFAAPPVAPIPRRYTLDEVRYSPDLRAHMRSVDLDAINFESGSWEVTPDQVGKLQVIAQALQQTIQRNPNEIFLVEGYTDAVGNDVDNLSLSDRRAQSVANILTQNFRIPPENLTTQGYGEQYLKVQTQGPSRENRRVTIRRITPLISGQNQ